MPPGRRILPVVPFVSKIREEIFALFFILVILALANDPAITEKVRSNTSVQIAIGLAIIYCLYNRIPWSIAFLILFGIGIGFSGLLKDAWSSVHKTLNIVQPTNETEVKSSLKKSVTFEDEKKTDEKPIKEDAVEEEESSDSECGEVSKFFGWESDTEPEDNETEREEKKNQLKTFMTKKYTDKA